MTIGAGICFDENSVRAVLVNVWSLETAVQWSAENPANGQCNVTAAVIYDLFGGIVLRTPVNEVWHYYNQIDGVRMDLTDSQFTAPGALFTPPDPYKDETSDRDTAMQGIPQREYDTLRSTFLTQYQVRDT